MSNKARDELHARIADALASALGQPSEPARMRASEPADERYLVVEANGGRVDAWIASYDRNEAERPRWGDRDDVHVFALPPSNRAVRPDEVGPLAEAIAQAVTQDSGSEAHDRACATVADMLAPLADYRQLADEEWMRGYRNWAIFQLRRNCPVSDIIDALVAEVPVDEDLTVIITREHASRWLEKIIDEVNEGAEPDEPMGEEGDFID